jgi:glycosyltransferase involved in cell wall biosynthesis
VKKSLVAVDSLDYIDAASEVKNKYCLISSTMAHANQVDYIKKCGFKIIYEYIDEIHDDITPGAYDLMEFFVNLEKYRPVLLLASAKVLYDELKSRFGTKKLLLSQNGVNVDHFSYADNVVGKPAEMEKILSKGRKVVGYYGAFAPWLDYNLLNNLAKKRADLSFVYIGLDYGGNLKWLERLKNVYFLGPKEYDELPSYARWFDCTIIPFRRGKIAKSTSPVKLFEYMAMGLPTVCTRDLRECAGYEHVYMSKDDAEFEKNVDLAIADKQDDGKRQVLLGYARENTWGRRAGDIDEAIGRIEVAKKK